MANFGAPGFGIPQTSQTSSVFGSPTTASSPFGQQSALFGQSTGGFGTAQQGNMFGQTSQQTGSQSSFKPLFGQTASLSTSTANTQSQQSPAFGQPTSSTGLFQNVSSQSFGQNAGFGQSGGASLFPSSGFGQSSSTVSSPMSSPLFGRPTTASANISQVQPNFGQPSFGQSASSSTPMSGFGQTVTQVSSFSPSSAPLFGQPPGQSFGQTGGQMSTTGFSSSAASAPLSNISSTTATSLFGSQPASSAPIFGTGTTSQSPFSRTSTTGAASLFGKPASTSAAQFGTNTASQSPFAGSSSTGPAALFGKSVSSASTPFSETATQASSSAFGKASPVLFGRDQQSQPTLTSASSFGQSSAFTSGNAFAKSTGFATSSSASDKLFGKAESSAPGLGKFGSTDGPFGTTDDVRGGSLNKGAAGSNEDKATTGLFGKVEKVKSEPPNVTFGMNTGKLSAGFGVKKETSGRGSFKSENNSGLFGVKSENSQASGGFRTEGSTGLFGKKTEPEQSEAAQSVGLFGKRTEETGGSQRGRPRIGRDDHEAGKVEDRPRPSAQGTGLFGKPAPLSDMEHRGPSQGHAARGLFGKPEATGKTERALFGKQGGMPARRLSRSGTDDKDQGPGFRRQMSEELSSKVAIICRNLGPRFNNTNILRNHFRKFGEVTKVFPNPAKGQATVHFKTHEAAAEAKRRGRQLGRDGPTMTIFWSNYSGPGTPRQPASRELDRQPSRAVKRTRDESAPPSSKRISWQGDPELDDELQSMAGTQDMHRRQDPQPQPGTSRISQSQASPERRTRSASPTPVDVKADKIHTGMFEGAVARTTTERVHLLNLRDKYIRHYRKKKDTNITTAKAFLGNCPDMCPEKERYDREDKRRLSVYEMLPGSENFPGRNPPVDHSRAVKEYIRSSPDQDEPLPHELRPLPVLTQTMTFLLSEVANQGQDGHWADWFEYLWNRTRGIRKDITQQQLCDRATISLLEKCARFHIFCSERLCEEDAHAFDAKINNENLTKCLQTLKEFYTDLEKKQNCFCPSEPEFRAYMVLMNLNEGDILRQVQQLRPTVRTSREIKAAMQAYFALNSNNYIKFFRLVKEVSFSQACVMHRYFTQVRNKALLTMMRGYGMGNRPAQIPLSSLVQLLAFEDETEAQEFCEYYGFNVVDGEAVLDKAEYIEPEAAGPARRSLNLIESRRMVSIGEMINGEAFTDTRIIEPSSSFDRTDRFRSAVALPARSDDLSSKDIQRSSPVKREPQIPKHEPRIPKREPQIQRQQPQVPPVTQEPQMPSTEEIKQEMDPSTSQPQETAPQKLHFPTEFIKDTAKILFWEVINEMAGDLAKETVADVNFSLGFSSQIMDALVEQSLSEEMRKICKEVYDAEQEEHRRALEKEREERRERVALEVKDDILEDFISQEALNLATIEIREVKAILRRQCIERVTKDVNQDLIEEVYTDMVEEVADGVFETDVTKRLEELAECENTVKLSRAGRFLSRWKKQYTAVTKLKRAMQEFPVGANMDAAGQLNRLTAVDDMTIINKQFCISKRARLTLESPREIIARQKKIEHEMTVDSLYQRLLHHNTWQPLDLSKVVGKILASRVPGMKPAGPPTPPSPPSRSAPPVYWKLLLCLPETDNSPDSRESVTTWYLSEWLLAKFSYGEMPPAGESTKRFPPVYWKLLLCLPETDNSPDSRESVTTWYLSEWLLAKFSYGETPPAGESTKSKVISQCKSKLPSDTNTTKASQPAIGVCVRTVTGTLDRVDVREAEEKRLLLGSSGLVFVLPAGAPMNDPKAPYWKEHRLRLQRILEVRPMCQGLPLVVIAPVSADEMDSYKKVIRCMAIESVMEKGLVYDVQVVLVQTDYRYHHGVNVEDLDMLEEICESLQWIAESTRPPPTLTVSDLSDLLPRIVLDHYCKPTHQDLQRRGLPDQHPNCLLELYNRVIDNIVDSLTAHDLAALSWPVAEFASTSSGLPPAHWNSEDRFEYLTKTLRTLRLPEFYPMNANSDEWADLKRDLLQYVTTITGGAYDLARSTLHSRLNLFLGKIEEDFEQEEEDNCEAIYIQVPWNRFISLCIDYKVESTNLRDPVLLTSESEPDTLELTVAYDENQLRSFCPRAEWHHIVSEQSVMGTQSFDVPRAVIRTRQKSSPKLTPRERVIVADPQNISKVSVEARENASSLMRSLQSQRRRSDYFTKYLENALKPGEECEDTFNASGLDSVFHHNQSLDFSAVDNPSSIDATDYFHQSRNDLSRIFDNTRDISRRMSDIGGNVSDPHELSKLYGRKRTARLSEIFKDDPVAVRLKTPTLTEDFDSFKEDLKNERRRSQLFEKRLQSLLTNTPMDT